jgi:cell fate regulator YaaT (PSP1 superfamily)
MEYIVGVQFKKDGKIYFFNPDGLTLEKNTYVLVETIKGVELGQVVIPNKEIESDESENPHRMVLRVATEEDQKIHEENQLKAQKAFEICLKQIQEHRLPMHLVNAEYTFDNQKILFYFTAPNRIDFRDLVRSLASIFKTRIELRQIGIKDKAKFFSQTEDIEEKPKENQEWWVKFLFKKGFYR